MSARVVITEVANRVVIEDDVVRVISVGVQGPPGPEGPQGEPGSGSGASLPVADAGSLLVRGAADWEPLAAGAEGEALQVVSGAPAWGAVSGGGGGGGIVAGKIYPTGTAASFVLPGYNLSQTSLATVSLPANACGMIPIMLVDAGTFDYVAISVGTAAAGAIMRLGIYAASAAMRPAALIEDFGTVLANTTGVKLINLVPNLTLDPGYYFLACVSNNASAVPEAILSSSINGNSSLFSSTSTTSTLPPRIKSSHIVMSGDPVSAGLPDPAPDIIAGREDVPYMRLRLVH